MKYTIKTKAINYAKNCIIIPDKTLMICCTLHYVQVNDDMSHTEANITFSVIAFILINTGKLAEKM
jgi:hypothetical protein